MFWCACFALMCMVCFDMNEVHLWINLPNLHQAPPPAVCYDKLRPTDIMLTRNNKKYIFR